ncbi:diaminopimelate decarboxylase [Vallitalea pronyensis]|uniref:Diaminopimelate decarboxylase n=1 Tax=Vallitalea pronyensis TaxID=1348613 RepID=A0A8J8MM56_9FIRM|nr:diaminopimelate decarboxylase [Vallitalea pronyensis]QUI23838.1 diaminopimelate decarboxylase [Vallitalea pronyensis]
MSKKEILLSLTKKYGTPLYAYDLSIIRRQITTLKEILPVGFLLFYSIKANPNLGITTFVKDYVTGAEIASEGELYTAIYSGISPQQIIFVGPGKTQQELEYAIKNNILCIVVESISELKIINSISKTIGKKTSIALRINPKKELDGARIKMGGISKQFGIDEEKLDEVFKIMMTLENIEFEGIHVYVGTQILDTDNIIQNFRNILELAKSIQSIYNVKLKVVDFGGGFGIPYFSKEMPLNIISLRDGLQQVYDKYKKEFSSSTRFIVESGRFIMAESGCYLTKVLYKKESRGKTYLVTNGGANHHSSAAGIGRFVRHNFPIDIIQTHDNDLVKRVDIVGPLCTPSDVIAQNIELPEAKEGDTIAIMKSGAYGLTASMTYFLSHNHPAEVAYEKNSSYLIRERGKKEFLIENQYVIENYCVKKGGNMKNIELKVKNILGSVIQFQTDIEKINVEDDLFSLGMDSMNILKVIIEIESEFDFIFNDDELTADNFRQIKCIAENIERRIENV